jgi:hypothetical protein
MEKGKKAGLSKNVKECRICKSRRLAKYLDLGKMPLANAVLCSKNQKELFFPLEVLFCRDCFLSQLSVVVDPKLMFSNYVYRSSISRTFQKHCSGLAEEALAYFPGEENPLAVDIASNDGCLLQEFKKRKAKALGIEPARNIAEIAISRGIPTVIEFFTKETAQKIVEEHGKAKIVTLTNVLAHVDDLDGFVEAMKALTDDEGVCIIEVPYMANLIKKNEFDTVYHEHLSYFLVKPLKTLFEKHGMKVAKVEEFQIHGGSIRLTVVKEGNVRVPIRAETVQKFLDLEEKEKLYGLKTYLEFAKSLADIKRGFLAILKKHKKSRIAAFAASAKGNTLLNYCKIGPKEISFIIDETPEKQGCFFAGSHIPIYGFGELEKRKPDFLVILAWNFSKEIIDKTPGHRERKGKYIIPIPNPKIVESADEL